MVETHYPCIERALTTVDDELEITNAEKRAFERFRSRLSTVDPASQRTGGGVPVDGSPVMAVGVGMSRLEGSRYSASGRPTARP